MSFINLNLIPKEIRSKYFEEYIATTPLSIFMGDSPSNIIQTLDMPKGSGLTLTVALSGELDYTKPVIGFDQLSGNEQTLKANGDTITANLIRFADVLPGIQLQAQASPIDFYNMLKNKLQRANQKYLIKSIFDTACGSIALGGLYNVATSTPSIDRGAYAGITNPGQYPANINDGVGAMAGADYEHNGLSVEHLRLLKTMATQGGIVFERENKITPYELRTRKGFPEETYVYLMDPASYNSLVKDPVWNTYFSNGSLRSADQPSGIMGSRFRGMAEGILVYECPELAQYRVTSNGKIASWNLFCGGQAFGLAWAERPWFEMDKRDYGVIAAMAVSEIRGQKTWAFPGKQNPNVLIERGLIHSFTQIA